MTEIKLKASLLFWLGNLYGKSFKWRLDGSANLLVHIRTLFEKPKIIHNFNKTMVLVSRKESLRTLHFLCALCVKTKGVDSIYSFYFVFFKTIG